MDSNTFGSTAAAKESVACSFPVEIIESILAHVQVPPMVVAAAYLPPLWREVIEGSAKIRRRINNYTVPINNKIRNRTHGDRRVTKRAEDKKYVSNKFQLSNGTLFIHQHKKHGWEGFVFAPQIAQSPLRILDPANKTVKYTVGPRFGYGYIDLRDFNGLLVCSKDVSSREQTALWEYVKASCAARVDINKNAYASTSGRGLQDESKASRVLEPKKVEGRVTKKKANPSTNNKRSLNKRLEMARRSEVRARQENSQEVISPCIIF